MKYQEINFDGLVGPTHNYSGLALGNVASANNKGNVASPKAAALQGLGKMRALHKMGLSQGILPPHERPFLPVLKQLGYCGSDSEIIKKVALENPNLLYATSSASNMWTANAATISPSLDSKDGRCHFTPANLSAHFHRAIEAKQTARTLKAIFSDEKHFCHHQPLPSHAWFSDEGAANHIRLFNPNRNTSDAKNHRSALEVFIYGRHVANSEAPIPQKFPARQTRESFEAIARSHGLKHALFAQQNPHAIDAGVFHNDVISVGHENILFAHEAAFADKKSLLNEINEYFKDDGNFHYIEIKNQQVSVEECVKSYLFNSQILTLNDASRLLLLPMECQESSRVRETLDDMLDTQNAISAVKFMDLRESMRNGGGPACLRLRVSLNEKERSSINAKVVINESLLVTLEDWVNKHYRDELTQNDLHDPQLLIESRTALDELTKILELGSIYPFQM